MKTITAELTDMVVENLASLGILDVLKRIEEVQICKNPTETFSRIMRFKSVRFNEPIPDRWLKRSKKRLVTIQHFQKLPAGPELNFRLSTIGSLAK